LLERQALGLDGLLPPAVETIEEQSFRAYKAYLRKPDDLERHIYLRQLQDINEVLFYRLLLDHIEEMLPIVYTPVVAEACQEFSHRASGSGRAFVACTDRASPGCGGNRTCCRGAGAA
jgi:malate dehydrogenase (oxaloacetate-decarboxylating)